MDVREKLVELIRKGARGHTFMPTETIANYLVENGVTVQDNTEISDELLKQLRNAPLTVLHEEPTIELVQEWISVKERLPKEGENVLVFRDNGFAVSEIYMTDYEGKPMWNYTGLGGDPTHWMTLPQPPKGE